MSKNYARCLQFLSVLKNFIFRCALFEIYCSESNLKFKKKFLTSNLLGNFCYLLKYPRPISTYKCFFTNSKNTFFLFLLLLLFSKFLCEFWKKYYLGGIDAESGKFWSFRGKTLFKEISAIKKIAYVSVLINVSLMSFMSIMNDVNDECQFQMSITC